MNRREVILMALAPAKGESHTPVQAQKLLFLIDREISNLIGGPYFNFQPHGYGPFDKAVYNVLESLASEGYVDILPKKTWRNYKLTALGQEYGDTLLNTMPVEVKDYVVKVSQFVRSLSVAELVSAIYKAYPEMRENSVFQE